MKAVAMYSRANEEEDIESTWVLRLQARHTSWFAVGCKSREATRFKLNSWSMKAAVTCVQKGGGKLAHWARYLSIRIT